MKAKELVINKKKITYVYADSTLQEAVLAFAKSSYSMIPVLERESDRYLYSITATDVLNWVADGHHIDEAKQTPLSALSLTRLIAPCQENAELSSIADLVANQNYVPLVDEKGVFAGIVTRKNLIFRLLGELDRRNDR